ncbi:MAG TPA: hypothetical protein DCM28_08425 [Phycisphaerales bacterium]|mgnify:FL=1|nr:hypothetical protein [Phycisphaerales bacterium]HCD34600.1 hypothetical protein [Phycisphaerales bacterium]|tara:strand:- start:531 stop:1379 length:849 start_codon:yes stop_codon:yes gene_type:complete
MSRFIAFIVVLGALCLPTFAEDDLSKLSDEFDTPATLKDWQRISKDHGTPDQLEIFDINKTKSGHMVMVPYSSVWYQRYRGVLAYKTVSGDFVITTAIKTSNRAKNAAPRRSYSLAGIMIHTPVDPTGAHNYIFLSHGSAQRPGTYQFEVKTTVNNRSKLQVDNAGTDHAIIQVARIGDTVITLKQVNGVWSVHQRYHRPDFPTTMQAGLTCYTDWDTCKNIQPLQHNRTVIKNGQPDLYAEFDYVRYARPKVPASLQGRSLMNTQQVSDAQLLRFLGKNAH